MGTSAGAGPASPAGDGLGLVVSSKKPRSQPGGWSGWVWKKDERKTEVCV